MAMQTKSKKQDKKPKLIKIKLPASEARVGDMIITKSLPSGKIVGTRRLVAEDFAICNDKWRTHIHIGTVCYDERFSTIDIAVEDDRDEEQELADQIGVTVEQLHKMVTTKIPTAAEVFNAIFGSGS